MAEYTAIAEDYPVLEPGIYQAIFDRVEPSKEPGQFGDYLNWYFTALTEDGPTEVMGRSSLPPKFTRSTKGREWYEALAGRPLAAGETMSFGKLKGTACTLTIDVKKSERGDSNRITNIRRTARPAPAPAPEPGLAAEGESPQPAQPDDLAF